MKELIQDDKWWKDHSKGIGFFATHKAIKKYEERFFIGSAAEIQKYLGSKWKVFSI